MTARHEVIEERRDSILYLTLSAEESRNALSLPLLRRLGDLLRAADAEPSLAVVVLGAAGPVFCAGADLKAAQKTGMGPLLSEIVAVQRLMLSLSKPVVAAVQGPVRAGGIGLVAAADLAIAGQSADFAFSEVRLGLAAAVVGLTVLSRVDPRWASDMLLTGRVAGAEEASASGLLTRCVADGCLSEIVDDVVDELAQGDPQGVQATKHLLNGSIIESIDARGSELAETSARLFASESAQRHMRRLLAARSGRVGGKRPVPA